MDNMELFKEEIETIREFSGLDINVFRDVLDSTRCVVNKMGNNVSPVAVIDIIEGAVSNLIYNVDNKPMTVTEAIGSAIINLRLLEDIDETFKDGVLSIINNENNSGKVRR